MPTFAIPIDREGVTKKSGAIAQLVEQRTENPCVPGSIPGGTTQKTAIEAILLRFFVYILWPIFRQLPYQQGPFNQYDVSQSLAQRKTLEHANIHCEPSEAYLCALRCA